MEVPNALRASMVQTSLPLLVNQCGVTVGCESKGVVPITVHYVLTKNFRGPQDLVDIVKNASNNSMVIEWLDEQLKVVGSDEFERVLYIGYSYRSLPDGDKKLMIDVHFGGCRSS